MKFSTAGFLPAFLTVAVVLAGCQTHTWAPGPSAQGSYEEASARCSIMARHSGGSYYAQGSPGYVAGAMAGAAIGEAIRAQADFNDCMMASGWVATDQQNKPSAEQTAARQQADQIVGDIRNCIAAARANLRYAPIVPHLLSNATNRYTLVQMSDTGYASPIEAQLVASYFDEADACRDSHMADIERMDPRAANQLRQYASVYRELNLRVVNLQIGWGEYAREGQAVADAVAQGQVAALPAIARQVRAAGPTGAAPAPAPNPMAPCTHDQQVQSRIARMNGYTDGPKCD